MARFNVGDKAVYPAHGVGEIKRIESKNLGGASVDCYVLSIISSGATVMVPVAASEKAGMRFLMSDDEINRIFTILKSPSKISSRAWNKRCREFNDKLRSGSMDEVAEVLRDLWQQQELKGLSFGEKQMLSKCRDLVVSEISAAQNVPTEQIEGQISRLFVVSE